MSSMIPEEYIYGKENRKNGVNVSVAVQIIFCYYIKWKKRVGASAWMLVLLALKKECSAHSVRTSLTGSYKTIIANRII